MGCLRAQCWHPSCLRYICCSLGDLTRRGGVDFHLYADDYQLYIAFGIDNRLITVSKMELLINDISSLMTQNKLKFNDEEAEIVVLNRACSPDATFPPLQILYNRLYCTLGSGT